MIDIAKLSSDERLALIEQLWDSLSAKPENIPVTDAQILELDRRIAEMDQDGDIGIPADLVLSRLGTKQH